MEATTHTRLVELTPSVETALKRLLEYLWEAEQADFETTEEESKKAHIFCDLVRVDRWLLNPEANGSDIL